MNKIIIWKFPYTILFILLFTTLFLVCIIVTLTINTRCLQLSINKDHAVHDFGMNIGIIVLIVNLREREWNLREFWAVVSV